MRLKEPESSIAFAPFFHAKGEYVLLCKVIQSQEKLNVEFAKRDRVVGLVSCCLAAAVPTLAVAL